MIRVLIADDSPTARGLLTAILSSDPEIRVVGEATNGLEAIELTRKLRPDLVTMDIRMPRMDGLAATKEIMIENPTPIIIVTASRAVHDIEMSMQTLRIGALALLEKPAGPGTSNFDEMARQLITHVKAMAHVKVVRHWRTPNRATVRATTPTSTVRVVAIAASTGGPAALAALLSELPADFSAPILIVQHISKGFIGGLVDWLDKVSPLEVKISKSDEILQPKTVYLAPDDLHLGASPSGRIVLEASAPIGGFRPSASFLFESVARSYGAQAAGVILTGMGEDGVAGLRVLRQAGGSVIAQDEKSCVVFGMPGAAVAAGLAHAILSLEDIAPRLVDLAK